MKSFVVVIIILCLLLPYSLLADSRPQITQGSDHIIYGGAFNTSKTARDTITLIGPPSSGAIALGTFENAEGFSDWNGWTHYDATEPTESWWQISDYMASGLGQAPQPGNLAAWCGELGFAPCDEEDPAGGYGNNWNEILQWTGTVDNPGLGVEVHWELFANIDTEPGYDYVTFQYVGEEGVVFLSTHDGIYSNEQFNFDFTLTPADYQGEAGDQVHLQVWFESDGGWSDIDCLWPTAGAIQMDDVTVTLTQNEIPVSDFADFESGWGNWSIHIPRGVGDFSQLWVGLDDLDPCRSNSTSQVAFIDDGMIVPGVGPSICQLWCYGPYGYIVNNTGGRLGEDGHLHNLVESPVIAWPGVGYEGALFDFDVYRHELLGATMPGIFYTWSIRSTGSDDPDDIQLESWMDRNFVYMGGPDYKRESNHVGDLLEPGTRFVQVQLTAYELGFVWGFNGTNGTPAPYFDNVKLQAYPLVGPSMVAREIDLAQDNFPAIGEVDLANLGNNSVRVDMANNIFIGWDEGLDPGDSLVVNVAPGRAGAELVEAPTLNFLIQQNPLFDEYRTSADFGSAAMGELAGIQAQINGNIIPDRWTFDLPDSNFLFPGDVLHYYIKATDDNGMGAETSLMPADTTGFSDFSQALSYDSSFTMRALPSVFEDSNNPDELITPKILFWNDFGNRGGENEWHGSLANLGFVPGVDYDTYYTNAPASGLGNGLGGRATANSLVGYDALLYSSGDLRSFTISDGETNGDMGNDVGVLDAWLRLGGKDAFFTGDNLISDQYYNNALAFQFVWDWFGLNYQSPSIKSLIGNQTAPLVRTMPSNGVFQDDMQWVAFGGCMDLNEFDVVEAKVEEGAVKLAEFLAPDGSPSVYSYSAGTLMTNADYDAKIISMPYDFMYIWDDPNSSKNSASLPTRVLILESVLAYFGMEGRPAEITPVPGLEKFEVRSYPNPFNPVSRIEYTMPKAGHLTLKVFNVRGELVKTIIDEHIDSSGHALWDGTDARGAAVSSGVYFYEARTGGQVQVQKAVLMK